MMIEFKEIAGTVWGGGVFPWTFVITKNNRTGHWVASARDATDPLQRQPRNNLGADFATLQAAQDACIAFLVKQKNRIV